MFLAAGMLSGCSSAFYLSSADPGADDVYYNPNRTYTAATAQPEMNPTNSNDPRIAELQKRMNTSMSDAVADTTSTAVDTTNVVQKDENPYNSILASSYQDAQNRRDAAQADPSMNYSDLQTALFYASAYDPAFYNVIVYGSHVWVEPKYMYTGWYRPVSSFSYYGGYGYPYSSSVYLGFGYSPFDYGFYPFSYGLGLAFYDPYYGWNDWGFDRYHNNYGYNNYGYNNYGYNNYGYNNGRNSYYGPRRSSTGSVYNSSTMLRRSTPSSIARSRSEATNPNTTGVRRPYTNATNPNTGTAGYTRRPAANPRTTYTRPSELTGRRTPNASNYTPTYTRPSNGLRQNYNNNRPATSSTPANNYYRRPASSTTTTPSRPASTNEYRRPASTTNEYRRPASTNEFIRPASSGSVGTGTSNSNSGGGNAGTRRRR